MLTLDVRRDDPPSFRVDVSWFSSGGFAPKSSESLTRAFGRLWVLDQVIYTLQRAFADPALQQWQSDNDVSSRQRHKLLSRRQHRTKPKYQQSNTTQIGKDQSTDSTPSHRRHSPQTPHSTLHSTTVPSYRNIRMTGLYTHTQREREGVLDFFHARESRKLQSCHRAPQDSRVKSQDSRVSRVKVKTQEVYRVCRSAHIKV